MKPYQLIVLLLALPSIASAENRVEGDINCDGKNDIANIVYENKKVKVIVTLSNGKKANELVFGLGESISQSSLCGTKAILSAESLAKDLSDALGENPEGYKPSDSCIGLNLRGGECDSIHMFWNHKTNQLNWWRL